MKLEDAIKKAVIETCMANGVEDKEGILFYNAIAMNSVGQNSVAAYKAWQTMAENSARHQRNRRSRR